MLDEKQTVEDIEEIDLVENQELEQDTPEEVSETTQDLSDSILDVLLGEAKKNEEDEKEDEVEEDAHEDEDEVKEGAHEDEVEEDEDEVKEGAHEDEEEDIEEGAHEEEDEVEEDAHEDEVEEEEEDEVEMPEDKTKGGILSASFDALKGMKKSQLVSAYKAINPIAEGEHEEDSDMPKTKADMINAMYGQLKAMKKDELTASYKNIMASHCNESTEEGANALEEDLSVLVDAEQNLTEDFKSKAATLFEAALANRVTSIKEELEEQYNEDLKEEVEYIREKLVTKIDDYLSYVVETWIEENQEFVDNKLRTEITEDFMSALQGVFTEHYIEVPEGKRNLVDELSEDLSSANESLADAQESNIILSEKVVSLEKEKVITEASSDLATTESAKLASMVEEIEFVDADTFADKVATIKENFFSDSNKEETPNVETKSSTQTQTIVEGAGDPNAKLSSDMQKYTSALSRFKD